MSTTIKGQIVRTLGTVGTLCFLAMPYTMDTPYFLPLAIGGNLFLLPQVLISKQYNLVLLNVVALVGYGIKLFSTFF